MKKQMIGLTFDDKSIYPDTDYFMCSGEMYLPEDELAFMGHLVGTYGAGELLKRLCSVEYSNTAFQQTFK